MLRRSFFLVFCCLFALAGAAQAATVLRVTVPEYGMKTRPYFNDLKAAFEKANPDIEVDWEFVPWDGLRQKLTTEIGGGNNTDLVILSTTWLPDLVNQSLLAPLDGLLPKAFTDRFLPNFLARQALGGKQYGLPVAASVRALFYNKDIFERAKIASPPATWDELIEDARKIKALNEANTFGFGLQGKGAETDVYMYYLMWSLGGEILDANNHSALGSPASVQALTTYKSMVDQGLTEPGVTAYIRDDVQVLFKRGQLAMMISAPFLSTQIRTEAPNLKYGIAPVPAATTSVTYGVTDTIALFDNSKHKAEAAKLLVFMYQPDWKLRQDRDEGFLPVTLDEAALPEFAGDPDLGIFMALLPKARFLPLVPGWPGAALATINSLQKVYLGQAEPADGLRSRPPTTWTRRCVSNKCAGPSCPGRWWRPACCWPAASSLIRCGNCSCSRPTR